MFEVCVKTLEGCSRTFQIEDDDFTVAAFKQRITEEMSIPIERQRLIFQGKVLIDDRKLKDCGVASNTIHLVPRPPPQPNQPTASSSSGPSGSQQQQPSFTAPNFMNFRQTMSSLLSAMPNFAPSGNALFMQSDNSGNIDIEVNIPFGEMCNNQFRQLQVQSTQLLNAMDGTSSSVVITPTSSASMDEQNSTASATTGSENSPSASSSSQRTTSPLNFQRLADMLAEQRRLWQRLGPHMDRWEAMLRSEHDLRTRTSTSEGVAEDASGHGVPTANTPSELNDGVAIDSSSAPTVEERKQEPMDTNDSTTNIEWSHGFFNQVSALLHLHAHMLHLLSDFYVISTSPPTDNSATVSASGVPPPSSSVPTGETQTSSASTNRALQNRSLVINEPDSSILYAHINIEPTVVTIARPVVNLSRGENEGSRGRRSQSANPPASAASDAGEESAAAPSETETPGSSMNIPTAVVIETPVWRTAQSAVLDHLIDSISSRVISQPRTQQQSQQQHRPQQGEGQSSSPRAPRPRVRNTASSGNSRRSAAPLLTGLLPNRHSDTFLPCNSRHFSGTNANAIHLPIRRRRSYVGPTAGVGASTPRRQSTVGTASRRGRSAGPQIDVNSAPTAVSSSAASPNNSQNLLRSMASAVNPNGVNADFFNRTIGDVTAQLTQLVAHGIGSGLGAAATTTASNTSGSTTLGPFTWIINNPQSGGIQFIPPPQFVFQPTSGSSTTVNTSPSDSGVRLTMLPSLLIDSLIRSMWSFIVELARDQTSPESMPNVDLSSWRSGANFPFTSRSEDLSRIRPVMVSLVQNLHNATSEREEADPVLTIRHIVDLMNSSVQNMLERNLEPTHYNVRSELVDLLLNNYSTDEAVNESPEREIVAWVTSLAAPLGVAPLDLRRSLHNFLTDSLSRQLPLWRDTGSHGILGTILLNSLETIMVELLGFCDLLVQRAAERLGLRLDSVNVANVTDSAPAGNARANRVMNFGHAMPFDSVTSALRGFDDTLHDGREREAMALVNLGVDSVITAYLNRGVDSFNENRERMQSYLVTRPLPAPSSDIPPPHSSGSGVEVDIADDSDVSEIYMDANEDASMNSPPNTAVATTSAVAPTSTVPSIAVAGTSSSTVLPEWRTDLANLPTDPLAPNALSEWRLSSENHTPSSLSAPAAFPREWAALVASDVAQMAVEGATGGGGASGGTAETDDQPPAARRLSDAYIAGMPSKRRRVMLERKQNLTCSANQLFMNILKEAMSLSPPPASPAGPTVGVAPVAEASTVTSTAGDSTASDLRQPPPQHVSEAFRAYVCEHLSRRLATDPDFDAQRHPAARDVFGKRPRDRK